ncbi:hypothetical protein PL81_16890, partial [Streptomyces sp. RSD-27]
GVEIVEQDQAVDQDELRGRRTALLHELAILNQLLEDHAAEPTEPLRCRCGRHECPPTGLSVAEVAQTAGVSRGTVGRWCQTGALSAIRSGRNWFIAEPLPDRVGNTRIPRARPET